MNGVLARLGDRLLERFVPKTVAAACEASTQATWIEYCNRCRNCQEVYKVCDFCGGVTTCTACAYLGKNCCG